MGLFRRKGERAIPESGSAEFDQAVQGTGKQDPRGEKPKRPPRRGALIRAVGRRVPNSGGFGAGIPKSKKKTAPDE